SSASVHVSAGNGGRDDTRICFLWVSTEAVVSRARSLQGGINRCDIRRNVHPFCQQRGKKDVCPVPHRFNYRGSGVTPCRTPWQRCDPGMPPAVIERHLNAEERVALAVVLGDGNVLIIDHTFSVA